MENAPRGNLNALKPKVHPRGLKVRLRRNRPPLRSVEVAKLALAVEDPPLADRRSASGGRRENARFHALVFAIAKLIHNADLTPAIVQRMVQFLESEDAQAESDNLF